MQLIGRYWRSKEQHEHNATLKGFKGICSYVLCILSSVNFVVCLAKAYFLERYLRNAEVTGVLRTFLQYVITVSKEISTSEVLRGIFSLKNPWCTVIKLTLSILLDSKPG